jgi:hypothetical protein
MATLQADILYAEIGEDIPGQGGDQAHKHPL